MAPASVSTALHQTSKLEMWSCGESSDRGNCVSLNFLLPPANVVCEGYVFTPVCDSVNRGGMRGCSGGWGGRHGCSRGCMVFSRGVCVVFWGVYMVFPKGGA